MNDLLLNTTQRDDIQESSHMAQLEEHERFLQVVGLFLTEEGMGR